MPLVLSGASLSQGLTQLKTLDCRGKRQQPDHIELYSLTCQVVCKEAELFYF